MVLYSFSEKRVWHISGFIQVGGDYLLRRRYYYNVHMTDLNHLLLTGRLVPDPVVRRSAKGTALAGFSVAANHYYRGKDGGFQRETAFLACLAFGRSAEMLSNRRKGEPVLVVGSMRTDTSEQESERRTQLKFICDSIRCFASYPRTPEPSTMTTDTEPRIKDEMPAEPKDSVPL